MKTSTGTTMWACALVGSATANMYDVIEPNKVAPAACKTGCDSWSNGHTGGWVDASQAKAAGSSCAQPGLLVDTHTNGAWCNCAQGPTKPTPAPTPAPDPDHPLDAKTFGMFNTYASENQYSTTLHSPPPHTYLRPTYIQSSRVLH